MNTDFLFVQDALDKVLSHAVNVEMVNPVQGGDINQALGVVTNRGRYFIKWNDRACADMFEAEAEGLIILKGARALRTPEIIGHGVLRDRSFLVLEYLQRGLQSKQYWEALGEGLAAQHLIKSSACGLNFNNYIGRLGQQNQTVNHWLSFFKTQRLEAQLKMASEAGIVSNHFISQFEKFLEKLEVILPESEASLLHGDLWSGNAMPTADGGASIYDPAVYFGAREMDLAMTKLFGGFDKLFYEAYGAVYSIPSGFDELVDVYNLYPLMVHVNLFGPNACYASTVSRIIDRYL